MTTEKSELEKALMTSFYGPGELKGEEKKQYLGQFRERVMKVLTKKQVMEKTIYPEIIKALEDKRSSKLIINGEINSDFIDKYEKPARELQKTCTIIHDPKLKGEIGLVVVSNDAIDIEDIYVEDREARLTRLGLSPELINAVGKKLCKDCFNKIVKIATDEAKNYRVITLMDRFWGEDCFVCDKD